MLRAQTWEVAEETAARARGIEAPGHRAGPRALALASDDGLLLSAAAGAAKLWNPRTGACVRTIETGQARAPALGALSNPAACTRPGRRAACAGCSPALLHACSGVVWAAAMHKELHGSSLLSSAYCPPYWE
jgi:U3 small nucleolar RNA-associated protein 12